MIGDAEILVVELLQELTCLLAARVGAHKLRAKGDNLILIVGAKYASVAIPEIINVDVQAREISIELEDGLTS